MLLMENKGEDTSGINNIDTTLLYKQAAKWQSISTLTIAFLAYWFAGFPGTVSALIGGGAVLLGGFVAARIAKRSKNSVNSGVILFSLLKAEAAKILIIILVLLAGFKVYAESVVPFALILALAVAALLSGTAIFALDKKDNR
jgi:ATP synthase protein I